MPYYDGRWHMFSEQERRDFGKANRAKVSKEWHAKWISKQGLKSDRLWTEKSILDFLGPPRDAGPIKAWPLKEVIAVENTESFKAWMQKRRAWLAERKNRGSNMEENDPPSRPGTELYARKHLEGGDRLPFDGVPWAEGPPVELGDWATRAARGIVYELHGRGAEFNEAFHPEKIPDSVRAEIIEVMAEIIRQAAAQ